MNKSLLTIAVASLLTPTSYVYAEKAAADETMVVTAGRFEQSTDSVIAQVEVITREDIDRIQAKSLTDVFRRLTGVQVTQNGGRGQNSSIFVRGANADQVLVLIDGIRFTRAAKGSVDFNQLPITFVDRVEYVRGARASVHGSEAIGGVINIITIAESTTNDSTKMTAGLGSLNYQELGLSTGVKVGDNGHLNVSVGYSSEDGYNVHPVKGVNDQDNHGFESRSGLIGYVHQLNEQWSAFANARLFENFSQYDGTYFSSLSKKYIYSYKEAEVQNSTFAGGVDFKNDSYRSELTASYQNQDNWNYTKSAGKYDKFASADELEQTNLQWVNSYQLNSEVHLNAGVDWRDEAYIVTTKNKEYDRKNTAYFVGANADYTSVFGELSARVDDNEQFGSEATYNSGLGYRFSEWLVAKAAYGSSFKAPNLYQLYSFYGDKKLAAESADSIELTLSGLVKDISWSVTGYDTKIENLIGYNFATKKYYNAPGESSLKGVEVVVEFNTDFISHSVTADVKSSKDQTGNQLKRRAKEMYKYDAIANFEEFDLSLGYQYVGERPDFSSELAAYSLFDASINYFANEQLTLNGRIDNLTDEKYETAGGYPSPERSFYVTATYEY